MITVFKYLFSCDVEDLLSLSFLPAENTIFTIILFLHGYNGILLITTSLIYIIYTYNYILYNTAVLETSKFNICIRLKLVIWKQLTVIGR